MSTIFPEPEKETGEPDPLYPDQNAVNSMHRGANWFYWIAGLSVVNSLIFAFGGNVSFILGLAYTQLVDSISDVIVADGGPSFIRAIAVIVNLGIVGIFVLIGYYAHKSFQGRVHHRNRHIWHRRVDLADAGRMVRARLSRLCSLFYH